MFNKEVIFRYVLNVLSDGYILLRRHNWTTGETYLLQVEALSVNLEGVLTAQYGLLSWGDINKTWTCASNENPVTLL